MNTKEMVVGPARDPEAQLERAFIEEFLRTRGHDLRSVQALPPADRQPLLERAALYAAAKLAEVEARAHYIHELGGER
jgi:hypothetical protein